MFREYLTSIEATYCRPIPQPQGVIGHSSARSYLGRDTSGQGSHRTPQGEGALGPLGSPSQGSLVCQRSYKKTHLGKASLQQIAPSGQYWAAAETLGNG
jgi:hypothetical protein